MKLSELISFFKKSHPKLNTANQYKKPAYSTARWGILNSPEISSNFIGTLAIDLPKLDSWAKNHATNTWTNQTNIQQAKNYFPEWISQITNNSDEFTQLDTEQRKFLQPYDLNFMNSGWGKVYCPICLMWHSHINVKTLDKSHAGKKLSWTEIWECPGRHLLKMKDHSIKIF